MGFMDNFLSEEDADQTKTEAYWRASPQSYRNASRLSG